MSVLKTQLLSDRHIITLAFFTLQARSEGAASEPESTDSESDDDSQPISCKNCHAKQPLFKARLIYKMCHGCYTYYCRYDIIKVKGESN